MTDAELKLWSWLRRRQLCNVQFYRQKPIGPYIADFYAPEGEIGCGSRWLSAFVSAEHQSGCGTG
ncbi:MAG: DUF559 domain-containing protein [Gammaproteobacteria bacterium]